MVSRQNAYFMTARHVRKSASERKSSPRNLVHLGNAMKSVLVIAFIRSVRAELRVLNCGSGREGVQGEGLRFEPGPISFIFAASERAIHQVDGRHIELSGMFEMVLRVQCVLQPDPSRLSGTCYSHDASSSMLLVLTKDRVCWQSIK